jgi:hypothetical protein
VKGSHFRRETRAGSRAAFRRRRIRPEKGVRANTPRAFPRQVERRRNLIPDPAQGRAAKGGSDEQRRPPS